MSAVGMHDAMIAAILGTAIHRAIAQISAGRMKIANMPSIFIAERQR
jgi:hypothetical protein